VCWATQVLLFACLGQDDMLSRASRVRHRIGWLTAPPRSGASTEGGLIDGNALLRLIRRARLTEKYGWIGVTSKLLRYQTLPGWRGKGTDVRPQERYEIFQGHSYQKSLVCRRLPQHPCPPLPPTRVAHRQIRSSPDISTTGVDCATVARTWRLWFGLAFHLVHGIRRRKLMRTRIFGCRWSRFLVY
jgi:hypothetical protein